MDTEAPGLPSPPPVRSSRTARDMALSLLVLLVPLVLIVGAYRFLQEGDRPVAVDTAPVIAKAAKAAAFPVLAPVGLGAGWRPASAVYRAEATGSTLRVGYTTPSGGGLQLVESDLPADQLLARELGDGPRLTGSVTVAGVPWQRYSVRDGETALVRTEPLRTIVVLGRASEMELTRLAGSLR